MRPKPRSCVMVRETVPKFRVKSILMAVWHCAAVAFTVAAGSGQGFLAVSRVPAEVNRFALVTDAMAGKLRRVAS